MSRSLMERRRFLLSSILGVLAGNGLIAAPMLEGCGDERLNEPTEAGVRDAGPLTDDATALFGDATSRADAGDPPDLGVCPDPLPGDVHTSDDGGSGRGRDWQAVCLPVPEAGACDVSYNQACILARYACGIIRGGRSVDAPMLSTDACCWKVSGICAVGRPFVVDGRAVLASLVSPPRPEGQWALDDEVLATELAQDAAALDDVTRAVIADVFARDGLTEHASIASFAQHVLELLALGAPASLVVDAQRALGEEIAHARRAFLVASAYAGAPMGPGPLVIAGALDRPLTLESFAARAAAEGCVAETIAALQLHAAADAATASGRAALASLLRATAEEEAEHALLAWRVVGWAIAKGGVAVRDAVARVLARAPEHVGFGPYAEEACNPALLRAHGVLSRRERRELAVAALDAVFVPVRRSLSACAGPATAG